MHRTAVASALYSSCLSRRLESSSAARRILRSSSTCTSPPRPRDAKVSSYYAGQSKQEFLNLRKVKKHATKLIDRATREWERSDWHHTPSLRGEEKRLLAALKSKEPAHGLSMDQEAFESDDAAMAEEGASVAGTVPFGSFVETRRNLIFTHGIVVGEMEINRRWRIGILTSNGEIWWPVREDIHFCIPNIAPPELIHRCGNLEENVPTNKIQIQARIEILKRLREVEKIMDRAYHAALQKSAKIYDTFRSQEPNTWSQVSVEDVARHNHKNPDIYALFATHKYMMSNPLCFVAARTYDATQAFNVRPKAHVSEIESVQKWLRIPEGPLQSFARKAVEVMRRHRLILEESRGERPRQTPAAHFWSDEDKVILSFLQHSLRQTRSSQTDPYSLGRSAIMKAINPKSPMIDDQTVHQTLIELGVFAPWQDLASLSPELGLDQEPESSSSQTTVRQVLASRPPLSSSKTPLGPEDFYSNDPLDAIRHDFGELPVFVIDETSAEELDDGISVERIPSEPENHWVHIHIADPASLIPPAHILARKAEKQYSTAYFIHRSWPLFPRWLVHDSEHGLSLTSREGHPTKVLTFSAKINGAGDILDFKVRAGLVRNVHVVTYDDVDCALGHAKPPVWYPFGKRHGNPSSPQHTLSQNHTKDLQALFSVSQAMVTKRQREGVFVVGQPVVDIWNVDPVLSDIRSPTFTPSTFGGFPTYEYRVMDLSDMDSGAHSMVAELMKIASRVASRFCLEHNLPALRRTADMNQARVSTDVEAVLRMRTPNNYVRHDRVAQYLGLGPAASYSLEPLDHFSLGVLDGGGYIRSTSPLRRYLDLVHHWQIHHGLLGSSGPPPFDATRLQELAVSVISIERLGNITQRNHKAFWQVMILRRWLEDTTAGRIKPDENPLEKLMGTIMARPVLSSETRKFHTEVHVRHLGMKAVLENMNHSDLPVGAEVPVRVHATSLGMKPGLAVMTI